MRSFIGWCSSDRRCRIPELVETGSDQCSGRGRAFRSRECISCSFGPLQAPHSNSYSTFVWVWEPLSGDKKAWPQPQVCHRCSLLFLGRHAHGPAPSPHYSAQKDVIGAEAVSSSSGFGGGCTKTTLKTLLLVHASSTGCTKQHEQLLNASCKF